MEFEIGPDDLLLAQELGQSQHHVGRGDARLRLARQLDADDLGQTHPGRAAQHHVLGLQPADADGDHAQRIDVRGMAVGADQGIGEGHAVPRLDHRTHPLQIDLMHDAVAGRDHVDIVEGQLGPLDEVEAIGVAPILDGAVLGEGLGVIAAALDRQRMVDDELHRHHRIDLGRIAALIGDGIAQTGQIDQRRLAQDVMTDHARREPGEIALALALDDLSERIAQDRRITAPDQILGQHARGIGQSVVGAGRDRFNRGAGVEIVQIGSRQGLAVGGIHRCSSFLM